MGKYKSVRTKMNKASQKQRITSIITITMILLFDYDYFELQLVSLLEGKSTNQWDPYSTAAPVHRVNPTTGIYLYK
jgi:hypothetical protein